MKIKHLGLRIVSSGALTLFLAAQAAGTALAGWYNNEYTPNYHYKKYEDDCKLHKPKPKKPKPKPKPFSKRDFII